MSFTQDFVVHKYLCHRVSILKFVNMRHKNQAYYSDLVNLKKNWHYYIIRTFLLEQQLY